MKKTFRDWAGVESEEKRVLIRNVLSSAAASAISSDDVVRMFIDWIGRYSVLSTTLPELLAALSGARLARVRFEKARLMPTSTNCYFAS